MSTRVNTLKRLGIDCRKAVIDDDYRGKCVTRTYQWADLARAYRAVTAPDFTARRDNGALEYLVRRWANATADSFYGASPGEITTRLDSGYELPPLDEAIELPESQDSHGVRRRRTDDSSGEFDYVDYVNGEAEFYRLRNRPVPKPGLTIEFTLCASAGTGVDVMTAYARWVGAAIESIRAAGYDVALACRNETTKTMRGEDRTITRISLATFGEVSFEHDWGAIFSPGGYRHLVFLAKALPEELENRAVSTTLGAPAQKNEWSVDWDIESRTLLINCPKTPSKFPDHDMTTQLAEIRERI